MNDTVLNKDWRILKQICDQDEFISINITDICLVGDAVSSRFSSISFLFLFSGFQLLLACSAADIQTHFMTSAATVRDGLTNGPTGPRGP